MMDSSDPFLASSPSQQTTFAPRVPSTFPNREHKSEFGSYFFILLKALEEFIRHLDEEISAFLKLEDEGLVLEKKGRGWREEKLLRFGLSSLFWEDMCNDVAPLLERYDLQVTSKEVKAFRRMSRAILLGPLETECAKRSFLSPRKLAKEWVRRNRELATRKSPTAAQDELDRERPLLNYLRLLKKDPKDQPTTPIAKRMASARASGTSPRKPESLHDAEARESAPSTPQLPQVPRILPLPGLPDVPTK